MEMVCCVMEIDSKPTVYLHVFVRCRVCFLLYALTAAVSLGVRFAYVDVVLILCVVPTSNSKWHVLVLCLRTVTWLRSAVRGRRL